MFCFVAVVCAALFWLERELRNDLVIPETFTAVVMYIGLSIEFWVIAPYVIGKISQRELLTEIQDQVMKGFSQ